MVQLLHLKNKAKLNKNTKIWTLDIETKDGLKGKQFFCGYIAEKSNKSLLFNTEIEMLSYILRASTLHKDKKRIRCYVHNLGFDVRFLVSACLKYKIR